RAEYAHLRRLLSVLTGLRVDLGPLDRFGHPDHRWHVLVRACGVRRAYKRAARAAAPPAARPSTCARSGATRCWWAFDRSAGRPLDEHALSGLHVTDSRWYTGHG